MSSNDDTAAPDSSPGDAHRLGAEGREVLAGTVAKLGLEGGLLLHAMAERMGVAVTDLCCLLLLVVEGPATAGRLASRCGVTTGAITGVVDRLSRGGWVARRPDPEDRRRVVIDLLETGWPELLRALAPFPAAATELTSGLEAAPGTVDATTALHVLRLAGDAFASGAERLRRPLDPSAGSAGPGVASAVLRLSAWASATVVIRTADLGPDLARVADGPVDVRTRAGAVTLTPVRGRRGAMTPVVVEVHAGVVWEVEVSGGANRLRVELPRVPVSALSVRGGANRVELVLPLPLGPTPVQITGGANRVQLSRPPGVPVRVRVRGGAHDVRVDGVRLDPGWSGDTGTGALAASGPCYDLDVSGGASKLVVD